MVRDNKYEVDLQTMKQKNLATGFYRDVKRRDLHKSMASVSLNRDSEEEDDGSSTHSHSDNPTTEVAWEFKGDDGVWTQYDDNIADELEKAYVSSSPPVVKFSFKGTQVAADVAGMMQKAGKIQPLRRLGEFAWECSTDTGWVPYSADLSFSVERALLGRLLSLVSGGKSDPCTVPFLMGGKSFEVDVVGLLQVNTGTGWKRNLRRIGGFAWQWCDTGDVWRFYDADFAVELERLFLNGPSPTTSATTADGRYAVDVRKMKQTRSGTGTERRVRRLGSCYWAWRDAGGWVFYDTLDALAIEAAYQSRSAAPVTLRSGKYSVSVASMKQKNLSTDFERDVRRIDIKGNVASAPLVVAAAAAAAAAPGCPSLFLPAHWDKSAKMDPVAVVAVPAGSQEFAEVKTQFELTAKGFTIVSVERVQNKTLWYRYSIGRESMNARAPPSARAQEMRLFHGTKPDSVAKINVQGFNRTFAGQNATYFGKGVYFARDASYSAQDTYSPPDAGGNRRMYLALVAVGDACRGGKDELVPSKARPGSSSAHDLCDSTVDNEGSPSIFVTYNDTQQYPDYLITFRK